LNEIFDEKISNIFSIKYFFYCIFFLQFLVSKPCIRSRIGIQPKMLDPDPDPESMNPDPKHWNRFSFSAPEMLHGYFSFHTCVPYTVLYVWIVPVHCMKPPNKISKLAREEAE
jgi:hypothetical protein